ncbi:MAG: hypothetical protein HY823_00360 [Acidobacteria bacterium]|nr:hypothetical protein [Acidobacteriota bacterium]
MIPLKLRVFSLLRRRSLLWAFPLALAGTTATKVPWTEFTEADWIHGLATRFATVDGHRVHYPTPPAELAKLLETRSESAALRHLAEARLELGDRPGALTAMERWASAEGPAAWAETARWAFAHHEPAAAFRAAERALPGLPDAERRALADERVRWADRFPGQADPIALRQARAALFPGDPLPLEDWIRALERAHRLEEADRALASARALTPERRLLLRSDLLADHGNLRGALQVLDDAVAQPWSIDLRRAFARRVNAALPTAPDTWRARLEKTYDGAALVRLATWFQGQGRGDAAADLLRQVERRHEGGFTREAHLLQARLYQEIDAIPEAFRATLAAAHLGSAEEQASDIGALARLALRAGGRPLALGRYNEEAYRWAARVDRTPGFWTGGISFLLTGLDWNDALARLESASLPDRTFALARWLVGELERRVPTHPELPPLRVALMERHVERGEGKAALDLLPALESGPPATADAARRVALLAVRQAPVPIQEELRLMKARLRFLAPDGSRPSGRAEASEGEGESGEEAPGEARPWARPPKGTAPPSHGELLNESLARLEHRDPSHLSSLNLVLGELDRLPEAEQLWMDLASRLEGWNLDDELGPRYERAIQRFHGPGIWQRSARWYARRARHAELRGLATALAGAFRGSDIFSRCDGAGELRVEIPEQPPVGTRIRLVAWGDWVRLKALERFPQSPRVFHESRRLLSESQWRKVVRPEQAYPSVAPVVAPDGLLELRRWAILFVDPEERERFFATAMRQGSLATRLAALETQKDRTPVEDLLLFEGWSRLSGFERAVPAADRLAANYPGDGELARRVLTLHRSLNGLDAAHAAPARTLVARVAPALEDPAPLWTELGELEEERGNPQAAKEIWKQILDHDPRNPGRIAELATLLWDYNHDAEALKVIEEGRLRLDRPRFFAFETGVLRENLKDAEGAVREYLDALRPEQAAGYGSAYERDQRSLRRLAQLLGRERIRGIVERRIRALKAGDPGEERTLAAFFPMATIEAPTPGLAWDADAWIDGMDLPSDPVGRDARAARMAGERPAQYDGIARIGDVLLEKAQEMVPRATSREFLSAVQVWSESLIEKRWSRDRIVSFRNASMARQAALAPDEGARIRLEVLRAKYLAEQGRGPEADSVWAALDARIGAIPEGSARLRAESERAGYLERTKGVGAAAAEWRRLTGLFPWSLGLLEDRLAFLQRTGLGEEGRRAIEEVLPRAASGHREALLERLTRECIAAADLPRARRAVETWLAEASLEGSRRIQAVHLLARLSYKEQAAWDPFPLARAESARLKEGEQADLWQQLARAADLESAKALPLWIEALNRRTERDWLAAASRSAQRTGQGDELLGFFEKQQLRSPRDVRWAVAVRDIRRAFHQVDGAIEAAKSAVSVRPEREILWREAADLLVRADRIREAADYLEGWNRPRPADEDVARWRSELYARAGSGDRALAVERAALEAFRKEAKDKTELAQRRARAAIRLMDLGLPNLALNLFSPQGDILALSGSRVPAAKQCELALLVDQFPKLVARHEGDADFLAAAASTFRTSARPEQGDQLRAFLLGRLLPQGQVQADPGALQAWWTFVGQSGLEAQLRFALAGSLASARPGPWQTSPPLPFLERASAGLITRVQGFGGRQVWACREPDWSRLWAQDLARRDRPGELFAYVEPRWQDLLQQVKSLRPVTAEGPRLPWAPWFDDPKVLETWSREATRRPEKGPELAEVLSHRGNWDRFWALAARGWDPAPLLRLAPQPARSAWFGFWEKPVPPDPVSQARRRKVDETTQALARLIQGLPGASEDPLIVKLRGPQSVGEVMGRNARWVWAEFQPRRNERGENIEQGEDRVSGSGVDAGRIPGALWGDRPGEAWYVLETLARYRQRDETALVLPLEVPRRGHETERLLLAMGLARGLGRPDLAMQMDREHPPAPGDRRRLEASVAQFAAAGRKDEAQEALRTFLRHGQGSLTEASFRGQAALAEEHGLGTPLDLLDPGKPVGPAFLAFLHDQRREASGTFHTEDTTGFRLALLNRWRGREDELSAGQVRFWLQELWATGSGPLPVGGLRKLGGAWPHAAEWLGGRPVPERRAALEAMEEAMNPAVAQPRRFPWPGPGAEEVLRLLALRLRLARHELPQALAMVDEMLQEYRREEGLGLPASVQEAERPAGREEGEGDEEGESSAAPSQLEPRFDDPMVNRLRAWLKPFTDLRKAEAVEERLRQLLRLRRGRGAVSVAAWTLAFQVTPPSDLDALAGELEGAWFRGDLHPDQLGTLAETLALLRPGDLPRWLARWPRSHGFAHARQRAAILVVAKLPAQASTVLGESRKRTLWRTEEEIQAFDFWRRRIGSSPDARVPSAWARALSYWVPRPPGSPGTSLLDHLRGNPSDALAARSALRTPQPADEDTMVRVGLALGDRHLSAQDRLLTRLKVARGLLPGSWRAAGSALGQASPADLRRMMVERRMKTADIHAALADLARLAGRAGDEPRAKEFLAILGERKAPNLQALYAELEKERPATPEAYRVVDGRPAPIRPRDLTWTLVAQVLKSEGIR